MRDPNSVIDEKEMDTSRVQCEIEALRLVISFLIDDADQADISVPGHASSAAIRSVRMVSNHGAEISRLEPWT